MAKSLADFLEELDTNASLKADYMKDAVGTAKAYGLSDEDVATIKNKDWDAVEKQFKALGRDTKVHTY